MRYLALLRGVNLGKDRKVVMADLRSVFEECGLADATTHANSGNVLFTTDRIVGPDLVAECEETFAQKFGFPTRVVIISEDDVRQAIDSAPSWWAAEGDWRHDALFVIPPARATSVLASVGEWDESVERIFHHEGVIFWSVHPQRYGESRLSRLSLLPVYQELTVRSSTTTLNLARLLGE